VTQADTDDPQREPDRPWRRWLPLAIVVLAIGAFFALGLHRVFTFEMLTANYLALKATISDQWLTAMAVFAMVYMVSTALSLPVGAVLTVAGGLLFGWWQNTLIVVISATVGASILFWIARTALRDLFERRAGKWLNRLAEGFREDEANYLLFLRLVPVFPFALVNFAPGILGVSFVTYVWTTFVGIAPGTAAYSFAGEGLASVIERQAELRQACLAAGTADCGFSFDPGALVTPELVIAFAALGVVALIPPVVRRLRRRSAE
jgi:uncharacterized membrane protein YdjX (TVP38/TMEM64 family)